MPVRNIYRFRVTRQPGAIQISSHKPTSRYWSGKRSWSAGHRPEPSLEIPALRLGCCL